MRINILAGGLGGSVGAMQSDLNRLYSNIDNTIDDLRELNRKIKRVNGGTHNLESAIAGIDRRIQTEETKKANLETTSQKISTFLSNVIQTDAAVAREVRQNQKQFLNEFPWLRPQDTNTEPSIWEQMAAAWDEFWGEAGDWVSNLVSNIVDYIKEHAVELIVGLVFVVVAAALTYFTGGIFLAALGKLLAATVIQGLISGVISGVIAMFTGGDFWDAFGDGFAQGFMWGGIFAAISSAITAIRGIIQGLNYADDAMNVIDDVANVADDAANTVDDTANLADDVANVADDVANNYPRYSKEALDELTDIDNYGDEAIEHLFEGQAKRYGSSGYHYEGVDDVAGNVMDGTRTVTDDFLVYEADVIVDGTNIPKRSSFFPREWTPQQVIDNINQAFNKLNVQPGASGRFVSYTDDGMEIAIVLRNGKIHTAYPIWQGT